MTAWCTRTTTPRPRWWSGTAVLAGTCVVTLLVLGAAGADAPVRLVVAALDRTAGTLTVGALLVALLLTTRPRPLGSDAGRVVGTVGFLRRLAGVATVVWLGAASARLWLDHRAGSPEPPLLGPLVVQALVVVALRPTAGALVGAGSGSDWAGRGQSRLATALGLAVVAVLVSTLSADHDSGWRRLLVALHVVPATLWVGGLAAVVVTAARLWGDRRYLTWTALVYSDVALAMASCVLGTGLLLLVLWLRDNSWDQLIGSADGRLRLCKVVAMTALVPIGAVHREYSLTVLERTGNALVLVWAGLAELVLMGVAVALGVGLSQGVFR